MYIGPMQDDVPNDDYDLDDLYADYLNDWPHVDNNSPLSRDDWEFMCHVWDGCYNLLWDIEGIERSQTGRHGKAWRAIQHLEYWLGV